jgi:hypothetical protein
MWQPLKQFSQNDLEKLSGSEGKKLETSLTTEFLTLPSCTQRLA